MRVFLGIDVGAVSTDLVLLDENNNVLNDVYLRTQGQPIKMIKEGLSIIRKENKGIPLEVIGVGTTGSGRVLAGAIVGADIIKNEITAHSVAALNLNPEVRTIFEIGGQDSKIIILQNGVVVDFAMNTICAAGTGSFLDHQAYRLGIPIEEFGEYALRSENPVRVAGRCTVFAESDMVHKQQMGYQEDDIIAGLCEAMVRNYLNNVGKGKKILPEIFFQGGVAANSGIKKSFEKEIGQKIIVPKYYRVMGSIGAALLAREEIEQNPRPSTFYGFELVDRDYQTSGFECDGCPNHCEVIKIIVDGETVARWGDRCGKWSLGYQTIR